MSVSLAENRIKEEISSNKGIDENDRWLEVEIKTKNSEALEKYESINNSPLSEEELKLLKKFYQSSARCAHNSRSYSTKNIEIILISLKQ